MIAEKLIKLFDTDIQDSFAGFEVASLAGITGSETRRPRGLRGVLCAAAFGTFLAHAYANEGMRRATRAEANDVTARAAAVFAEGGDVLEKPIAFLKPEKTLYWSAPQGGRLLVPVTVRFKGVSNAYCRLMTVEYGPAAPVLIDLPMDVNADTCRGFRDVRYLDINGDGKLDIVAKMTVKANFFNGYVDQQVVYLSVADKPGGYCYSAAASRNLEPAAMGSTDKVRQALDRERKRLGVIAMANVLLLAAISCRLRWKKHCQRRSEAIVMLRGYSRHTKSPALPTM